MDKKCTIHLTSPSLPHHTYDGCAFTMRITFPLWRLWSGAKVHFDVPFNIEIEIFKHSSWNRKRSIDKSKMQLCSKLTCPAKIEMRREKRQGLKLRVCEQKFPFNFYQCQTWNWKVFYSLSASFFHVMQLCFIWIVLPKNWTFPTQKKVTNEAAQHAKRKIWKSQQFAIYVSILHVHTDKIQITATVKYVHKSLKYFVRNTHPKKRMAAERACESTREKFIRME